MTLKEIRTATPEEENDINWHIGKAKERRTVITPPDPTAERVWEIIRDGDTAILEFEGDYSEAHLTVMRLRNRFAKEHQSTIQTRTLEESQRFKTLTIAVRKRRP